MTSDNEDFNFVDVVFGKPPAMNDHRGHHPKQPAEKTFNERIVENVSGSWPYPSVLAADTLRKLYPKHSLAMSQNLALFNLPGVAVQPLKDMPLTTNLMYAALPKKAGIPGLLFDQIELGGFNVSWNGNDYIVYVITIPAASYGYMKQAYILGEGPDSENQSRLLLLASGAWQYELHEEIWVYDQSYWDKSHDLWTEIQKADWKDVILKDDFKKAMQKDVYGFFSSEKTYKDLGIPWKRGLIMYGPPGNGKTISLKVIMKDCETKGFTPLYVKSFHHWAGDERGMYEVFNKARAVAPCVVILEDLDALINDFNRSFFLNQVDGLANNDGLLLIGTTNHFDRLDPGLSTRPSRFDRKYEFDDPDEESRKLYVLYWKKKLEDNHSIDFPDELVGEIAKLTDKFSFAYLKEAFVSALVILAGWDSDDKRPAFGSVIKKEISKLSKQLDKSKDYRVQSGVSASAPSRPPRPDSATERDLLAAFDAFSFTDTSRGQPGHTTSQPTSEEQTSDNIRSLANRLSDIADAQSFRRYCGGGSGSSRPEYAQPCEHNHGGRRYEGSHSSMDFGHSHRRDGHRRADRQRERHHVVDRLDRQYGRDGGIFDFGGTMYGYEPSYHRYPTASNIFPVPFTGNGAGPSGSDLA